MTSSAAQFLIGETVRVQGIVLQDGGEISRVGMIACEGEIPGTFDIIFSTKSNNRNLLGEENGVTVDRIRSLEDFEFETIEQHQLYRASAEENPENYGNYLQRLKDNSNLLFELKDIDAAYSKYQSILNIIGSFNPTECGATVIVLPEQARPAVGGSSAKCTLNLDFPCGIISDSISRAGQTYYEIEYDIDREDEDGANLVTKEQLIPIDGYCSRLTRSMDDKQSSSLKYRVWDVQRAIYLNLCRCALKCLQPSRAIRWSSIALAVTSFILNSGYSWDQPIMKKLTKNRADALFLRAKALLAANRPLLARKDANSLIKLDKQRADQLLSEIDVYLKKRAKSNRQLASNIAKWVETAMNSSNEMQTSAHLDDDELYMDDLEEPEAEAEGREAVTGRGDEGAENDESKCTLN